MLQDAQQPHVSVLEDVVLVSVVLEMVVVTLCPAAAHLTAGTAGYACDSR